MAKGMCFLISGESDAVMSVDAGTAAVVGSNVGRR
jgi:hypothetical protein